MVGGEDPLRRLFKLSRLTGQDSFGDAVFARAAGGRKGRRQTWTWHHCNKTNEAAQ